MFRFHVPSSSVMVYSCNSCPGTDPDLRRGCSLRDELEDEPTGGSSSESDQSKSCRRALTSEDCLWRCLLRVEGCAVSKFVLNFVRENRDLVFAGVGGTGGTGGGGSGGSGSGSGGNSSCCSCAR